MERRRHPGQCLGEIGLRLLGRRHAAFGVCFHDRAREIQEVQALKAEPLAREEAYRRALASDDAAVLRSFLALYHKGIDVDQVRAQLRVVEPGQSQWPPRAALIVGCALAVVLAAGAGMFWIKNKSPSEPRIAAVTPAPTTVATPAAPSASGVLPPESKPAATPSPDQTAWLMLKDTTDEGALQRFIAQFLDSSLRETAQARIADLAAAQAAKPVPPSPDEVSWTLLKDTTDEGALKRFTAQRRIRRCDAFRPARFRQTRLHHRDGRRVTRCDQCRARH